MCTHFFGYKDIVSKNKFTKYINGFLFYAQNAHTPTPTRSYKNKRTKCIFIKVEQKAEELYEDGWCPLIRKLPLKPSDCFQNITGFCIL